VGRVMIHGERVMIRREGVMVREERVMTEFIITKNLAPDIYEV